MKFFLLRYVEPNGRVGDEEKRNISLASVRSFLSGYDAKGQPAAVVIQPFERGADFRIARSYTPKIRFNRLGAKDTVLRQTVSRLVQDYYTSRNWKPGVTRTPARPSKAIPKAPKATVTSIVRKRTSKTFEQWLVDNGYRRTRSGWLSPDGKKFFPL